MDCHLSYAKRPFCIILSISVLRAKWVGLNNKVKGKEGMIRIVKILSGQSEK